MATETDGVTKSSSKQDQGPSANKPSRPKAIRRPRPLVEGINAPRGGTPPAQPLKPESPGNVTITSNLTDQERRLISETEDTTKPQKPMILSPSAIKGANRKNRALGKILTTGVILVLVILLGYWAYGWYINKKSGIVPATIPNPNYTSFNDTSTDMTTGMASSTMASSTMASASSSTSTLLNSPFSLAGAVTGTPPSNLSTATPNSMFNQLTINSTPTGYLNVRNEPSTSGTIVSKVHPGDTYSYSTSQNGWYEINLANGSSGWVDGQYITIK